MYGWIASKEALAQLVGVMLGGALGAGSRWALLSYFTYHAVGSPYSQLWAIVACNVIGSLLAGMWLAWPHADWPTLAVNAVGMGFLGGLTTFSTFMVDAFVLIRVWSIEVLGWYVLGSLTLGVAAVAVGYVVTTRLVVPLLP